MSAFNKRFVPFDIFGVPAATILGLVLCLSGGFLALLFPMPVNVLFAVIGVLGFILLIVGLILGDETQWISLKFRHQIEQRLPTLFGRDE